MDGPKIINVDRSDAGAIVDFSDGTTATFSAEELCVLRPQREVVDVRDISCDIIIGRNE